MIEPMQKKINTQYIVALEATNVAQHTTRTLAEAKSIASEYGSNGLECEIYRVETQQTITRVGIEEGDQWTQEERASMEARRSANKPARDSEQ